MKRLIACLLLGPAVAVAAPCPPRATLAAIAPEPTDPVTWTCTAIRGDEPRTLVVGFAPAKGTPRRFDPDSQLATGYVAVVDARGAVRWSHVSATGTPGDWYDWQVRDLDGDGHDELFAHHSHYGHIAITESLEVHARDTDDVTSALPLADRIDPKASGSNACKATYRLARAGRRTTIEITGKRGSDPALLPISDTACAADGVHLYRWTPEGFAQLNQ